MKQWWGLQGCKLFQIYVLWGSGSFRRQRPMHSVFGEKVYAARTGEEMSGIP